MSVGLSEDMVKVGAKEDGNQVIVTERMVTCLQHCWTDGTKAGDLRW